MSNRWLILIATALLCAAATVADAAQRYRPIGLGTLGGRESGASSIDESGRITGVAQDAEGKAHAVQWIDGQIVDLDPGAGLRKTEVMFVSVLTRVVVSPDGRTTLAGTMTDGSDKGKAYVWKQGEPVALTDGAEQVSYVSAANDAGQIVGNIVGPNGPSRAALWTDEGMTDIGDLDGSGDGWASAQAINSRGQIVGGSSSRRLGGDHAFVWQNGVMTGLDSLGGSTSIATAINDRGVIAGVSTLNDATAEFHAVMWKDGAAIDIGALECAGDPTVAYPYAINNRSQIVGLSAIGYGPDPENPKVSIAYVHAFIVENGAMQDLNQLIPADSGWELLTALDINDSGLIVGIGYYTEAGSDKPVRRAYVLVPLSETDPTAYGDWHADPGSPPSDPGLQAPPQPSDCDEDQPAELPAQAGPDQPVAPAPEQSEVEEPEQNAEPAPQQEVDIPTQTSDGVDTQDSQPTPTTSDDP